MGGLITIGIGFLLMVCGYFGAVYWWNGLLVALGVLMIPLGFIVLIVGIVNAIGSLVEYIQYHTPHRSNMRQHTVDLNDLEYQNLRKQAKQYYEQKKETQGQQNANDKQNERANSSKHNATYNRYRENTDRQGYSSNQKERTQYSQQEIPKQQHEMSLDECYNFLKVSPKATDAEVKKAYYKLAKQYHSDLYSNADEYAKAEANKYMQKLNNVRDRIKKARNN